MTTPSADDTAPAPAPTAGRGFVAVLTLLVGVIAGAQLWPYLAWSPEKLTTHGMLIDDAYFYSTVASNWLAHGFPSLDGEMPTNGFQPLWMGVQVLLQTLLDVDPIRLLTVTSWLAYVAFAFAATLLVVKGSRFESAVRAAVLGALVVLNPGFQELVVQGLEVPLALLLLVGTALVGRTALDPEQPASRRRDALFALLAGLTFLARTDLFWVAIICAIGLRRNRDGGFRRAWRFAGLVAVVVLPYLIWNVVEHGSPVPVSGRIKVHYMDTMYPTFSAYLGSEEVRGLGSAFSRSPAALLEGVPGRFTFEPLVLLAAVVESFGTFLFYVLGAAAVVFAWRGRWFRVLAYGCLIHIGVMFFLYRELRPYTAYYFAPEVLVLGIVLAEAGLRWAVNGTVVRRRVLIGVVAALCLLWGRSVQVAHVNRVPGPFWESRVRMAKDLPRHLGNPDRVGAFWPGVFAGFSGVRVTPLDGIIGSQEYFDDHVKPGTELDYARSKDIRDVVVFLPDGPAAVLGDEPPELAHWSHLGVLRIWEQRDRVRIVHAVPVDDSGAGWYLFRLE